MPRRPVPRLLAGLLALEDRTVPSGAAVVAQQGGAVTVRGTDHADTVRVWQQGGATIVQTDGAIRTFTGVASVRVDAGGGNDLVVLDGRDAKAALPTRLTVNGGGGDDSVAVYGPNDAFADGGDDNDRLWGGGGRNTLVGGTGADLIVGGAGTNEVYGGGGSDRIYGGVGSGRYEGGAGDDRLSLPAGGGQRFDGGTGFDTYYQPFDAAAVSPDGGKPSDVMQKGSATCVILASLAAVSETGVDLAGRIRPLGGGRYAVPIYREGTGWVTPTVVFDGTYTDADPRPTAHGDTWVLLYQRAYLQEMGVRWDDPNVDGWVAKYGDGFQRADRGLIALTGDARWRGESGSGLSSDDLSALRRAVAGGRPVIALTATPDERPRLNFAGVGLVARHAYAVVALRDDARGTWVRLRNPWGTDGPARQGADDGVIEISWNVFRAAMKGLAIA